MNRIGQFLKQVYRLSLNYEKQQNIVWKDLKNIHVQSNWRHGVYEAEKYIETIFEIREGKGAVFHYMVYGTTFECRALITDKYDIELTTDLFILATHFNNILNTGRVIIDTENETIQYQQKRDLLVPLLFNQEIHSQLNAHFNVTKDIYAAFTRLMTSEDAPAIIIADLIEEHNNKNASSSIE